MTFESTTIDELIKALRDVTAKRYQHREECAELYAKLDDSPTSQLVLRQLELIDALGVAVAGIGQAVIRYLDDEVTFSGETGFGGDEIPPIDD